MDTDDVSEYRTSLVFWLSQILEHLYVVQLNVKIWTTEILTHFYIIKPFKNSLKSGFWMLCCRISNVIRNPDVLKSGWRAVRNLDFHCTYKHCIVYLFTLIRCTHWNDMYLISIGSVSLVTGHFVSREFSFVWILEFALRALMMSERFLHSAVDPVKVLHVMHHLVHVHSVEATETAPVETVFHVKGFL